MKPRDTPNGEGITMTPAMVSAGLAVYLKWKSSDDYREDDLMRAIFGAMTLASSAIAPLPKDMEIMQAWHAERERGTARDSFDYFAAGFKASSEAPRIRVPLSEIAHMTKRLREYNPVEGQEGLRLRGILMREAAVMIEDLVGPPQTTVSETGEREDVKRLLEVMDCDSVDEAISIAEFDNRQSIEAALAIKLAGDMPENAWPSAHERRFFIALREQILASAPSATPRKRGKVVAAFISPDTSQWQGLTVNVTEDGSWWRWMGTEWVRDTGPLPEEV